MHEDSERLSQYVRTGSQAAFAELVQHNVALVYRAALRRVSGDAHLAQDVTQSVFIAVAHNASALAKHPDFIGWLYTTTRFLAAKAIRAEQRRRTREQEAFRRHEMMEESTSSASLAAQPSVLDDVLMELRQLDRQMILLRFHRGLRQAEIGAHLGVSENAVQKRLDRALELLREKLARRGITSTAAALAVAFEQQSAVAVPAGLTASVVSAGLACGGTGGLLSAATFMAISKVQIALAVAVGVGSSAALVWQVRAQTALRADLARQTAAIDADEAELRRQLGALTARAAAAEADAGKLEKAMQAVTEARQTLTNEDDEIRATLERARTLSAAGKYQEALDLYVASYRRSSGMTGAGHRLSVMSALKSLGRKFPAALAALRELREAAGQKVAANPDDRAAILEFARFNEVLGDSQASVALYDQLAPEHPGRQAIGLAAYEMFLESRRYADALTGKPYGNMLNELESGLRNRPVTDEASLAAYRQSVVRSTAKNIEVLIGAGHVDEAKELTGKLLAYDHSDATRATLQYHTARAGGATMR